MDTKQQQAVYKLNAKMDLLDIFIDNVLALEHNKKHKTVLSFTCDDTLENPIIKFEINGMLNKKFNKIKKAEQDKNSKDGGNPNPFINQIVLKKLNEID